MRFDSTTSSFLNLLVTKSFKKMKVQNSKKTVKKTFFVSAFLSCNPSARLKNLRWPVMIVKLRKGQKNQKF